MLRDGIAAVPDDLRLNWILAGLLERDGDIEGAIEIYERLYAANTDNLIIANNLASLLATGREDAESLERAHQIARRLRGRDVPAFQDTYGWIAFRRGEIDTAVTALESAAEGLPSDPGCSITWRASMTIWAATRTRWSGTAMWSRSSATARPPFSCPRSRTRSRGSRDRRDRRRGDLRRGRHRKLTPPVRPIGPAPLLQIRRSGVNCCIRMFRRPTGCHSIPVKIG